MKHLKTVWKTLLIYFFVLALLLVCVTCSAQVTAMQFNASWNAQNGVEWFNKLADCDTESHMIDGNDMQKKYIIFDDGEEVKRFQADLSFKMQATRKEIQDYIDELIISKF